MKRALLLALAAAVYPLAVFAQTGSIAGTITDTSGAVVPEARVTARNTATSQVRTTASTGTGTYALPALPPGTYDVSVEARGFSTAKFEAVTLTVAQALQLNATLTPGAVTEVVQVSAAAAPAIELENAQISNIITGRKITELPLVTRNPYDLVLLSPGTIQSNSGLGGFSVNGSRERNNNFLLDGIDNNDAAVPGIPGGASSLNPDSTEEFRVITNNFLAEYGRNTGAIIEVVTKGGTNQVQGNAYWFGRYNALAARDTFNPKGEPQHPFVRNMFGGSLGGPVVKDRTFFFVNNEWQRYRTTLTQESVLPTPEFKSGLFTYQGRTIDLRSPNSANNAQRLPLDPTMQKVFALLPNPNGERVDDIRGIYRFPSKSVYDSANLAFRVDHKLDDRHTLNLRYSYNGTRDPNPQFDELFPGFGTIGSDSQAHAVAASLTSTLSPTVVNQFRAGVNRSDVPFYCTGTAALDALREKDAFGAATDYAISGIGGIGCGSLGDSVAQTRRAGTWMFVDSLSFVRGAHNMKGGVEYRRVFENGFNAFGSRQQLDFDYYSTLSRAVVNPIPNQTCNARNGNNCLGLQLQNMSAALFGLVARQSQSQFFDKSGQRTATDDRRLRQNEFAFYFQDSWKIRSSLTLSLGARYQLFGVPFETQDGLSNLFADPAGAAPLTFAVVGPGTGRSLYNSDLNNIEPRFGFSWDPFRKGKTSIRGGYGIFHDRVFGNLFGNLRGNPPFQQDYTGVVRRQGTTLATLGVPPVQTPSAVVEDESYLYPVLIDRNVRNPISQNWNLGLQHDFSRGFSLDVAYVASKANRLFRVVDGNPPQPSLVQKLLASGTDPNELQFDGLTFSDPPVTGNTAILPSLIKTIANSTYHSLQVRAVQRFTRYAEIEAAYTWAHAIDDASDPLEATSGNRSFPRNSLNLKQERGNSGFDVRHRVVLTYSLEFPFGKGQRWLGRGAGAWLLGGWKLVGYSTFQTGLPYDIFGERDNQFTTVASRVDLVGSPAIPAGSRTQTGPLLSAFAEAPFGLTRVPTLGRNVFYGPGSMNSDVSLIRETKLGERRRAQLRVETFNVFNRPQFSQPGNLLGNPGTFGISTSTVTRADGTTSNRQIQLGFKLYF